MSQERHYQRKQKVMVAIPAGGCQNHVSITNLFWQLGVLNTSPYHPFEYDTMIAEDMHPHDKARNSLSRCFLATDADLIWMIDSDAKMPKNWQLLFEHFIRPRLLDIKGGIAPSKIRAVSGLAFGWQSGVPEIGRTPKPTPVVYRFNPAAENGFEGEDLQAEPFFADAVGAHCIVLRRDLVEEVGCPWFRFGYGEEGEITCGEDIHFFRKALALGDRVLIDTRVRVGHWKWTDTMDIAEYGVNVRRGAMKEKEQCQSAAG